VGVPPSEIWSAGDQIRATLVRRKSTGWRLRSDLPATASLSEHAERLLGMIYPQATAIAELESVDMWFSFAVYVYDADRPPLRLPRNMVSRIAELGAGIDIDLYNL
jgi:hypothetical protein